MNCFNFDFNSIKDQEKQFQDVITQQASLINKRKGMFLEAAKEAGIKLGTKFDIKDFASYKAEMLMEQIRMLKRAFKDSFGFDVLGSERELGELVTIKHFLLNFFGGQMCDKMAISAYILKIVEKDPFLRLQMFNRRQFFFHK